MLKIVLFLQAGVGVWGQPFTRAPAHHDDARDLPRSVPFTPARLGIGGAWSGYHSPYPDRPSATGENVHLEGRTSIFSALLETRHIPSPVSPAPGTSAPERRRVYASGELEQPWLYLAVGRRYLPGPRTSFLGHPVLFHGPGDFPAALRTGSLFAHLPGMPYLPGLFALEGVSGTGLYFTDPERTFLLAYHPTARQGGLTVRSGRAGDGWRLNWMADIQHNERTTAGFARLHLRPDEARRTMDALDQYAEPSAPSPTALHDLTHIDEHAFELLVEAQRREIWDYRDFAEDDIYPGRRGKSGLAFLRTRLGGVAFEAAGQDIGDEGMRVARLSGGLDLGSKDALAAQRLEIDAGGYRRRRYGSESTEQYRDPAVGLGWRLDTRAAFMRLRGERRGSGLVSGEVVSGMRAGAYTFEIAGVFRDRTPALSPLARALLLEDPEEMAGQEQRTELETETPRSVILASSGLEHEGVVDDHDAVVAGLGELQLLDALDCPG